MGENGFCATSRSAQDLLTEFQQTGQEAPFAEIARRYAGMVYNVALRVTHDAHDAEDATQATFLTLAVHAKTSGKIRFLGPWLKKVSHRLALDIRRSKKRRTAREQRHAASNGVESNGNGHDLPVSAGLHTEELRNILREEIDRLPVKYRMPLILYYFGGLTPDEIGQQLHCNTSTLGVRLHRGRKMLADSLGARGISMNAAIVAAVLGGLVDTFVKDNVVHATTSAVHVSASSFVSAGGTSSHVLHLMRIATSALKWARMKTVVGAVVLMVSTFALGREAIQRIDISHLSLRNLNPMRLIQPLLDRIFVRPLLSQQTNPASTTIHEMPRVDGASDIPLFVNSSIPDFALTTLPPLRSVETSFASTLNVQRSPTSIPPISVVVQPPPVMSVSAVPAVPAYQPPPVVSHRSSAVSGALSAAPQVAAVPVASNPIPAFVMPAPNQPLIIDRKSGNVTLAGAAVSSFTLPNTLTRVPTVVVGDVTAGKLFQDSGTLQATQSLVVGKQAGSKGTFHVSRVAHVESPQIVVGDAGSGTIIQNGGTVDATTPDHTGEVVLGAQPTGSGTYTLASGNLTADTIVVGQQGQGLVDQTGGTPSATVVKLGAEQGGSGTWKSTLFTPILTSLPMDPATALKLADLSQSPAAPVVPQIVIGGSGTGTFVVQPSDNAGTTVIQEQPDARGSSLIIRSDVSGDGTFHGSGIVAMTGPLVQNARVIADGYGTHKALDFSAASKVSNTIENAPNGGTNGWYAHNLGSLVLPRMTITGSKNYTWGEDTLDDTIDLINSVRFVPHSSLADGPSGDAGITLLDPNDPDIAGLPDGRRSIGLWGLDTTADISSIDLTVRFDDQLAAALNLSLSDLTLWAYQDKWIQVDDSSVALDLTQDLISGTVNGAFSYFAVGGLPAAEQLLVDSPPPPSPALGSTSLSSVSIPEPGATLFTIAALGTLLSFRRSRRAQSKLDDANVI